MMSGKMDSTDSTTLAFNSGCSLPDTEATGPGGESIADWRQRASIDTSGQIRIVKLTHMRYQHPDLDQISAFLHDFGMRTVKRTEDRAWFRGGGPDPYVYFAQKGPKKFLGGTFEVETYEDLRKASAMPGASGVEALQDAPGGGSLVAVPDPEGNLINLIHRQLPAETQAMSKKLVLNYECDKPRVRRFQRFSEGPAAVYKLGHYGLCVHDFDRQMDWYMRHFNFVPTDFLYVPGEGKGGMTTVAVFAHVDRGPDFVDHHTIFLSKGPSSHVHHCSFEVHDLDAQQLGHQWLARKGYESVWGVGRHILGSQIFDYWWDTTGNMIEHYADGDLVNGDTPVGLLPAAHESLAVWGPDVPQTFLD